MTNHLQNVTQFLNGLELKALQVLACEKCFCNFIDSKGFLEITGLAKGKKSKNGGLFGYSGSTPDYQGQDIVLEVKVIRGNGEYEFKNALGQLAEQAIANCVNNAILLVYDQGRMKDCELGDHEKNFIDIFRYIRVNNSELKLVLLRLRLIKDQEIKVDFYPSS